MSDWPERLGIVAGASLITIAPYLYFRLGHNTLTSQWLILAAIYGFLFMRRWPQIAAFAMIFGASVLIHPYFTPMVLLLAVTAAARNFWMEEKRLSIETVKRTIALPTGAYIFALAAAYMLAGLWRLEGHSDSAVGYYSMDPLAWFNSMGSSLILPGWETGPGQYEGFQYLVSCPVDNFT